MSEGILWVLHFVKVFLCTYGEGDMVFIPQFVNVVYHTVGFVDIEESFHPWAKSHSILVYDPFYIFLDPFKILLLVFC